MDGILDDPQGAGDPSETALLLPIYQSGRVAGLGENPDNDRFLLSVPLIVGALPAYGALTARNLYRKPGRASGSLDGSGAVEARISGLVVRPGEGVHFGFRFTDRERKEQRLTASTNVITQPVFDLMREARPQSAPVRVGSTPAGMLLRIQAEKHPYRRRRNLKRICSEMVFWALQ